MEERDRLGDVRNVERIKLSQNSRASLMHPRERVTTGKNYMKGLRHVSRSRLLMQDPDCAGWPSSGDTEPAAVLKTQHKRYSNIGELQESSEEEEK